MLNLYCVYCIDNSFALNENHGAVIVNFLEHQLSSLFLLCVINNEAVIVNPMNESEFGLKLLYQLFREVVLYVGVETIMHMVTDNAANYVVAGKLLMEEFPSIFCSPCALIASTSYSRTLVNCSRFVVLLSMLLVSQRTFIIIVIHCI